MAYIKRDRYKVSSNNNLKDELLEVLCGKDNVSSTKARQLVYCSVPMTLIRWSKYLTSTEMDTYLELVTDEDIDKDLGI